MTALMVCLGSVFGVASLTNFEAAAIVYLGVFAAVPVACSIDLGANLPLISLQRLLASPLIVILAFQVWLSRGPLLRIPGMLPLCLMGAGMGLSALFSAYPSSAATFKAVSFWIEEIGIFTLAFAVLTSRRRIKVLVLGLCCTLAVVLGYMAIEFATRRNPLAEAALSFREGLVFDYTLGERFGLRRLQSVFRNPLDLGVYLLLVVPLALTLVSWRRPALKVVGVVLAVVGLMGAVLTGSRMVFYTFVATGMAYVVITRRWMLGLTAILLAGCIAGIASILLHFPVLEFLVTSAFNPNLYLLDVGGSSVESLSRVTGEHIALWMERPLFGWGVSTFPPTGMNFDPMRVGFGEQGISLLLAETGIVGFGGFVIFVAALLRRLWRGIADPSAAWGRPLAIACFSATVGYIVSMQLEGSWHFDLFLVLGAAAMRAIELKEPDAERLNA